MDGEQEAYLVALACRQPEEGQQRWTLQLLADKLVELHLVDKNLMGNGAQVLQTNDQLSGSRAVVSCHHEQLIVCLSDGRGA